MGKSAALDSSLARREMVSLVWIVAAMVDNPSALCHARGAQMSDEFWTHAGKQKVSEHPPRSSRSNPEAHRHPAVCGRLHAFGREFKASASDLRSVKGATASLQAQFDAHVCKDSDADPAV
jgi:hypothetical protein